MVEFRCKRSGNTVSFSNETDIASMRKESAYEEVPKPPVVSEPEILVEVAPEPHAEVAIPEIQRPAVEPQELKKKLGRPPKKWL